MKVGNIWESRIAHCEKIINEDVDLINQFLKFGLSHSEDYYHKNIRNRCHFNQLFNSFIEYCSDAQELLGKYPADKIGGRTIVKAKYNGNVFHTSNQFVINLYRLSLFKQYIPLKHDFTLVDVGGNYGLFVSLINREFPHSKQILVELPEQLKYAHFYLDKILPDNDISLICAEDTDKIKNVDVLTNFGSFGEMSQEFFDFYMNGIVKRCSFLFHINRVVKDYGYGYSIDILDYPHNDFDRIFFAVNPLYRFVFNNFGAKDYHQPLFVFIGKNKLKG